MSLTVLLTGVASLPQLTHVVRLRPKPVSARRKTYDTLHNGRDTDRSSILSCRVGWTEEAAAPPPKRVDRLASELRLWDDAAWSLFCEEDGLDT